MIKPPHLQLAPANESLVHLPCLSIITSVSSFHISPFLVVPGFLLPLLQSCAGCCCRGYYNVTLSEWRGGGIKKDEMEGELEQKIWCKFFLMNIVFLQAGKLVHSSCHSTSPPDPILISPSIIYQVAFPHKHLYMHCKEPPNTDCAQCMLIHLSAVLSAHGLWIWLAGICTMLFQFFRIGYISNELIDNTNVVLHSQTFDYDVKSGPHCNYSGEHWHVKWLNTFFCVRVQRCL